MYKRVAKSRRVSTLEESKELYNIECDGHTAQSLKVYGKHLRTCTMVLTSFKSSSRSSTEWDKMSKIFERCQTCRYQFMLIWCLLPPAIVVYSQWVFWQAGQVFNSYGIHVWAHWSCGTLVLIGSIGILLRK